MCWASEVVSGNIIHLKNGREPNAGAALFPYIPVAPLLFCGFTWMLQFLFGSGTIWILTGLFVAFTIVWAIEFSKLRGRFKQITAKCDDMKA